jgi:hypothetical protein
MAGGALRDGGAADGLFELAWQGLLVQVVGPRGVRPFRR